MLTILCVDFLHNCSWRLCMFACLVSQNSISTIGPGVFPSSNSLKLSIDKTSSILSYFCSIKICIAGSWPCTYLLDPFYDISLQFCNHDLICIPSITSPSTHFFIFQEGFILHFDNYHDALSKSFYLREGEECFPLQSPSDLIHNGGQFSHILFNVCMWD